MLYCRDIVAEINNYTSKTASGLYTYKIKSIKLSTLKSQLNVTGLTLKPVNANAFFSKSRGDRFTLRIDSLQLNHFDFLNYHKYRTFNASSLILTNGAVEVFNNPNKQRPDGADKVKSFPAAGLAKITADINLDTILVHHVNVTYTEYNEKSKETGSIHFNNTSGQFLNITNNKTALAKNKISTVKLTSYFMNQGKLDVQLAFNLTDENRAFSYKGSLGQMNLQAANPAVMPLGMVKIASGTLKKFEFDIHATREKASGKVGLLYNDLKVTILKPDTVFDNLKKKPIATLFANIFIVKHNNPDVPGSIPRTFFVNYNRAPEIPFFKYMWQTLLTGIKPCAGLNQEKQDEAKAMVQKQIINKENRKIKKEQRIARRAARRERRAERKMAKNDGNDG